MKVIKVKTLVNICLKSTYFIFIGDIYEHAEGIEMGSPLSRVIENLHMEYFGKTTLESFPIRLEEWKRFAHDTNIF